MGCWKLLHVRTCRGSGCWHLAAVTKVGKDVKLASALSQEKQMQNGDLWNFDILWRREQTGCPNIFHHCICFLFTYVEKIWDNLWSGYQFYFRSCWVFLPPIKKGYIVSVSHMKHISLMKLRKYFPRIQGIYIYLCPQTKYHFPIMSLIIVINGKCAILPSRPAKTKNKSERK